MPTDFIYVEVEYILGRFRSFTITDYLDCRRDGRGSSPRMEKSLRQNLLDQVLYPYLQWKEDLREYDWNDLALGLLNEHVIMPYQIIIADEVPDLSCKKELSEEELKQKLIVQAIIGIMMCASQTIAF